MGGDGGVDDAEGAVRWLEGVRRAAEPRKKPTYSGTAGGLQMICMLPNQKNLEPTIAIEDFDGPSRLSTGLRCAASALMNPIIPTH